MGARNCTCVQIFLCHIKFRYHLLQQVQVSESKNVCTVPTERLRRKRRRITRFNIEYTKIQNLPGYDFLYLIFARVKIWTSSHTVRMYVIEIWRMYRHERDRWSAERSVDSAVYVNHGRWRRKKNLTRIQKKRLCQGYLEWVWWESGTGRRYLGLRETVSGILHILTLFVHPTDIEYANAITFGSVLTESSRRSAGSEP